MKRLALLLFMLCSVSACSAESQPASTGGAQHSNTHSSTAVRSDANTMKIRVTINGKSMTATLIDSSTTRDLIAQLPLTLKLEDYASTEKIAYLPKKLSTQGAPAGINPDVGDITYYAPWGNLAIFYRDFGYSKGLVKLGQIDSGMEALSVPGPVKATIEAVAD
jgi:hypothetical protein